MTRPGARVIAIQLIDGDVVYTYGRGTYTGYDKVPDGAIVPLSFDGEYSPRIELDRGGTVYGCQCWWGDEDVLLNRFYDKQFIIVEPPENPRGPAN